MSNGRPDIPDNRLLPGGKEPGGTERNPLLPARQLQELPRDELRALAEELGLEPDRYRTLQLLVVALHERRQMIAALDREAMLDVVKWARRPVPSPTWALPT